MIILIGIITAALSLFDFAHFRPGRGARTLQIHPNLPSSDTFSREASYDDIQTFQKIKKRLAPENLSEIEVHNCRCHFRGFQLELHIVDTKNFEIGSVVAKLQLFENPCNVGNFWISVTNFS